MPYEGEGIDKNTGSDNEPLTATRDEHGSRVKLGIGSKQP